jgi:hypothetical protein
MLLTFTRIRNEVGKGNDIFNQATQTVTDMSAALGTDMKKQAIQVGKALNDPIKGISALQRVGVSFTASQKEQIKALVESGDIMGAQKIILKELATEFGGAAAAAATPWQRFKTLISHALEPLEPVILATMDKASRALQEHIIPAINDKIIPALQRLGGWFSTEVVPRVRQLAATWLPRLRAVFTTLATIITGTVIPAIAGTVRFFRDHQGLLKGLLITIGALIVITKLHAAAMAVQAAGGMLAFLGKYLMSLQLVKTATAVWTAMQWLLNLALTANPIGIIIVAVAAMVAAIVFVATKTDWFQRLWHHIWDHIGDPVKAVWRWISGTLWPGIQAVFGFIVAAARKVWDGIKLYFGFWRGLLAAVVGWVVGVKDRIVANFNTVVGFVKGLPGRIRSAASGMWNGIKDAFRAAINWVIDRWNSLSFTLPAVTILGQKFGGMTLSTPDIGRFHQGGIIPGIGEQLIVAKAREGVFTPEQMAALAPAGGLPPEVHVFIGDRELIDIVRVEVRDRSRGLRRRVEAGAGAAR